MDTQRYAAFIAAAETKSMSGAAKRLGYTPSGIVRLVNALEDELGFPVLSRSSAGVATTVEGQRLLPLFQQIINLEQQANRTSARIRDLAEGTLVVGITHTIAALWLPKAVALFQGCFPKVRLTVVEAGGTRLRQMLAQHEIDCCLLYGEHQGLDWTPLGTHELIAWVPTGSRLAKMEAVLLAELAEEPLICVESDEEGIIRRLLRERDIEANIRFSTTSFTTAAGLTAAGLGSCLCCNGAVEVDPALVAVKSLSPKRYLECGLAVQPVVANSPIVKEFTSFAAEYAATLPVVEHVEEE